MIIDGELIARAVRLCEELRACMGPDEMEFDPGPPADDDLRPDEAFLRRARAARPSRPARVDRGQLWVVAPERPSRGARALLLLTHVDGERVRGFVVSDEAWIARPGDVVLPGTETPVAEAMVVLIGRDVGIPRSRLLHFVGIVARDTLQRVLAVQGALRDATPIEHAGDVRRADLLGARRAAPTLARHRSIAADGAPLEWLCGTLLDDPEDPRIEAHEVMSWATAWIEAWAPYEVVSPARSPNAPSPGVGMIARIGALLASLPPMPHLDGALGLHALSGALRGPADEATRSWRFGVAVGSEALADVRLTAEPNRLRASAHVVGRDGTPRVGAHLRLRNIVTTEEAIGATDAQGVVLPVVLALRDSEAAEITLEVSGPNGVEVLRLAL